MTTRLMFSNEALSIYTHLPHFIATNADKDRLGRIAVKAIHEQMDDDKDGLIEASESSEFITEELESKTDAERHKQFQDADLHITVEDLWHQWHNSAVYNWTVDDVVDWLVNFVHLPMYVENFRRNQIDGRIIPRLAANEKHYITGIMHIRDPRHKRRLIIKATDVVLFGPPQNPHNLVKDMILMSALLISIGGCIYAFIRHRKTQEHMNIMMKELEALQKCEVDLIACTGKMKSMDNELKDKTKVDRGLLYAWYVEVQRTKEEAEKLRKLRDSTPDHDKQLKLSIQEIEQLRIALRKAEEHARHQSYEAPSELLELLQRTHDLEEAAFEIKRKLAENAMMNAKEHMTKISKMQKGFFGAVRIAHTSCMDDVGELINAAKEKLAEIQDEYEERERRWHKIAVLVNRDDFIGQIASNQSSSISTTTSPSIYNGSVTSGVNPAVGTCGEYAFSRSKSSTYDTCGLINSLDPSKINGSVHNNNRGLAINPPQPLRVIDDTLSQADSGLESSNSSSVTLKRRALNRPIRNGNSAIANFALSYSNSTTGIADMLYSGELNNRQNGSVVNMPSSLSDHSHQGYHQGYPSTIHSQESIDRMLPYETASQIFSCSNSVGTPDKTRKQFSATKIFKPFRSKKKELKQ
ncbi:unnamed protein product [Didymodactylos carnosus]|uniref:SAM domain-containing protein n=1 Tax=Didymodactylos carnosus TaxID=1234261 RepID=A0A813RHH8_9BILA|nr:unnamed protein product [Didymodactylos carnosus]CAF0780395.1 unnamed protein product [Didymodactylos carnosus]CAF3493492.1 unnamed protein product [Didymodactylos carnosus]CAF3563506.1 unnamed protein product [Didymodactylos carnosus]